MGNSTGHPFLYSQSPFLPVVNTSHVDEARRLIKVNHYPKPAAACISLFSVGIEQQVAISDQLDFLAQYFQCDDLGVSYWHMGYNSAPNIIVGAYISELFGSEEAQEFLMYEDEGNPLLSRINRYRENMLPQAIELIRNSSSGAEMFDIMASQPALDSRFYTIGVLAAKINYSDMMFKLREHTVH
ncbi:MAG: hypothetical protein UW35_C0027G0006 [Candidatus Collierbacteria bacterium GW2011_GWF2_44_15]|uniref:Uncharacterized protein n=6 Tax=Candidatus Collieribacteriota TaxID=1752725 RepID=A0A0G1JPN4_9BACT|nr:MAG: hypothetical protein UW23_C0004G0024 [Candidatus Collierbacteria bacterium GW2011_GWA1_44_12]KKT37629.1 MAG: hypothetical protein UW26_C0028G0004 [Candidatus Collierbacteria bacterium GW2011_GWF1_44_12]KKT45927.1 MAG: hypothetical protein UW35_C0027G0006 [Candidatus Collierbacteria bacterium GW2011_GWF2_44_15]KKU27516.1 MAG: hypothetical protein UX41_C0049G0002 [Candidatus Collierbacteria bacterium GW2011_GWE1_46_18]